MELTAEGRTPSLPDARPRSDRFRCGGRESEFLQSDEVFTRAFREADRDTFRVDIQSDEQ